MPSVVSLGLLGGALFLMCRFRNGISPSVSGIRTGSLIRRFRKPLPLIYLTYLMLSLVGGIVYPPSNYDALCYRLPRILHWWSQNGWHWIGGYNIRMDYSATGFEWLAAPLLVVFKSDRLLFLINVISYALMPGLVYSLLAGLGVVRRVAWAWMWILPTAYCFVLQAGSIGNDMFATIYFLAAAVFALRAVKSYCWSAASLSILAAALMTGAKASNIPLLLPLGFLLIRSRPILLGKPIRSLGLIVVASAVSFLPSIFINLKHTGDWTGDPTNSEKMKLSDPVAGLAGNSLQLLLGTVAPPVFPMAKTWNSASKRLMEGEPLRSIARHYPRFALSAGELATEEGAGLGPGILVLCLVMLGFVALRGGRLGKGAPAMIFGVLCWISLGVFLAKMGSESAARLVSPYYAGMVIPFLAFRNQGNLVGKSWWVVLAILCALTVLPAVLINPARPLVPPQELIGMLKILNSPAGTVDRINRVYSVYKDRPDVLSDLRSDLPTDALIVGFAGSGNEPEYSLWRPLGHSRVLDLGSAGSDRPDSVKLDCIVASEGGLRDRFALSSKNFAEAIGGTISRREKISVFAGKSPEEWIIIVPPAGRTFLIPPGGAPCDPWRGAGGHMDSGVR